MKTGLVWDEAFGRYDSGMQGVMEAPHPFFEPLPTIDRPLPKVRLKSLLDRTGMTERLVGISARAATRAELERVHTSEYVGRIAELSAGAGGDGGDCAPFGPGGYEIAALAAGGVLAAVDAVMAGSVDNAFALVHPPGHHALPHMGVGFCIFANGPLAALHARARWGVRRIAILDWDVHFGNAAQEIFWRDPDVLSISLHQADCYPAGGTAQETGADAGKGFTLNVPIPAGAGEPAYADAMSRVALPALRLFRPDLILVACGFDAGVFDPLGRMRLNAGSFGRMMASVRSLADEICGGRLVVTQEGGYDASSVPFHGLATIEALSGVSAGIDNPFWRPPPGEGSPPTSAERDAVSRAVQSFHEAARHWPSYEEAST